MRIGSLFSGAGGLDIAVQEVFDGEVVWFSEIDKAASKVLAHRFPGVPNLGDITAIEWNTVEPIDILCGGFPCTDVSAAGKRAGMHGTRSGLWSEFAKAIDILRPRMVVIENVRGLLSAHANRPMESDDVSVGDGGTVPVLRAAGAVLGDLADLGYDAQWTTLAAGDVCAPHRRERVFILAFNGNVPHTGHDARRPEHGIEHEVETGRVGESSHGATSDTGYRDESERAWATGREGGERPSVGGVVGRDGGAVAQPGGTPVGFNTGAASGAEAGAHPGDRSGDHRGKRADVELLPTPVVTDSADSARHTIVGGTSHPGTSLTDAIRGLPEDLWPTVRNAIGAEFGRQYGMADEQPFLADELNLDGVAHAVLSEVMLLPTPQAHDAKGPKTPEQVSTMRAKGAGVRNLNETAVHELLPTPGASDGSGGGQHPDKREGHSRQLIDYVLLCSPAASDGAGGKTSRSGGRIDEPLLGGQAREMETSWGKYEPAIRRWEQIVGPAPPPTEPNKNGNPRLAAQFSEWLMGWPAGWVTDPAIGISRNDQLRIVGNGVVSIQAAAAMRQLLAVAR
jgi:DNA (cytosine-5)-methyltransferase 1